VRALRRLLSRLRRRRGGIQLPAEARTLRVDLVPRLALCPVCSEWWRMEALVRHLLACHPGSPEAARIRSWLAEM